MLINGGGREEEEKWRDKGVTPGRNAYKWGREGF